MTNESEIKQIEKDLETLRLVREFLQAGKIPLGVRPEVMEICANLLSLDNFAPRLTGYNWKAIKGGVITCMTDNKKTAERHGKAKATFLRIVK